jgi:hypothetical protein
MATNLRHLRASRMLAVPVGVMALGGCYNFPSDWVDPVVYQALDYHLDRPRILSVRLDPPVAAPGVTVRIDALAMGPRDVAPGEASILLCGFKRDTLVELSDAECFRDASLVETLGTGLPFEWTVPDDLSAPCGDGWTPVADTAVADTGGRLRWPYGCTSSVPMQVRVPFGDTMAYAQVQVAVAMTRVPPADIPAAALANLRLEVLGDPSPEGVVTVRLSGDGPAEGTIVQWFTDDGEWLGTGRTRTDGGGEAVVGGASEWFQASNQLRLPRFADAPIRVVAVANHYGFELDAGGLGAWAVAEIALADDPAGRRPR